MGFPAVNKQAKRGLNGLFISFVYFFLIVSLETISLFTFYFIKPKNTMIGRKKEVFPRNLSDLQAMRKLEAEEKKGTDCPLALHGSRRPTASLS